MDFANTKYRLNSDQKKKPEKYKWKSCTRFTNSQPLITVENFRFSTLTSDRIASTSNVSFNWVTIQKPMLYTMQYIHMLVVNRQWATQSDNGVNFGNILRKQATDNGNDDDLNEHKHRIRIQHQLNHFILLSILFGLPCLGTLSFQFFCAIVDSFCLWWWTRISFILSPSPFFSVSSRFVHWVK